LQQAQSFGHCLGQVSWREIPESVISVWSFAANRQTCTSEEWTWRLDSVLGDSDEIKPLHLNFRCLDSEEDLKRIIMSGSSKSGKKNKPLYFLAEYLSLSSSCFLAHIKYIFLDILVCSIAVYYIDTSVSLENTSLVKFIRNHIRDSSGVFSNPH